MSEEQEKKYAPVDYCRIHPDTRVTSATIADIMLHNLGVEVTMPTVTAWRREGRLDGEKIGPEKKSRILFRLGDVMDAIKTKKIPPRKDSKPE